MRSHSAEPPYFWPFVWHWILTQSPRSSTVGRPLPRWGLLCGVCATLTKYWLLAFHAWSVQTWSGCGNAHVGDPASRPSV